MPLLGHFMFIEINIFNFHKKKNNFIANELKPLCLEKYIIIFICMRKK